jgi:hypothetical protein
VPGVEATAVEHYFMVEFRNVLNGEDDVRIVRIDRMKAPFTPAAPACATHGLPLASLGVPPSLRLPLPPAVSDFFSSLRAGLRLTCGASETKNSAGRAAPPRVRDGARELVGAAAPPDPRGFTPMNFGVELLVTPSTPEGERKPVTALLAEVKGSVDLCEKGQPCMELIALCRSG